MKIKEEDSQHLVIVNTFGERLIGVIMVVFASIFLAVYLSVFFEGRLANFSDALFIVLPLIFVYFGVRMLMGSRIVLDKSTDSVILEAPNILLIRKKRIIPFTDVEHVAITYESGGAQGRGSDEWQVSLYTGDKMVRIDHSTNIEKMSHLADTISRFTGKERVEH